MIARAARPARSGITLTEILISILIMGVGLISLATLFPLGLLRMREATRYNRTGLLFESAADDMDARSLLNKSTFIQTWYGPRDPFLLDINSNGVADATATNVQMMTTPSPGNPAKRMLFSGLPFAYDPLWYSVTGVMPGTAFADGSLTLDTTAYVEAAEVRFGAGVAAKSLINIRTDPDSGVPSAHGLQRLTNFIPYNNKNFTPLYKFTHFSLDPALSGAQPADVAANAFTSVDDIIFNGPSRRANDPSPLVPEQKVYSNGTFDPVMGDYKYSWFFTGRQVDATNSTQFVGDIVVCDSRPFGYDTPIGATQRVAAGETVVEAIFGFGINFEKASSYNNAIALGGDRSVLLRWPVGTPDPQVRVGGWIADVTYERNKATYESRYLNSLHKTNDQDNLTTVDTLTPYVRCHWYQVNKRTEAETETANSAGPNDPGNYRRMVLTINSNLRARTVMTKSNARPVNLNFALVMPSVINVFPRAFEVH